MKSIDTIKLKKAYALLQLLNRGHVKKVMGAISPMGSTVVELEIKLRTFEQCTISMYLRKLHEEQIVFMEQEGKFHRYYLNKYKINKINEALAKAKKAGVLKIEK